MRERKIETPMKVAELAAMLGSQEYQYTRHWLNIVLEDGNCINIKAIGDVLCVTKTVYEPEPYIVTGTLAEPYEPEKR